MARAPHDVRVRVERVPEARMAPLSLACLNDGTDGGQLVHAQPCLPKLPDVLAAARLEGWISPASALAVGHTPLEDGVELADKVLDFLQFDLAPQPLLEEIEDAPVKLELPATVLEEGVAQASIGPVEHRVANDVLDVGVLQPYWCGGRCWNWC